MQISNAFGQVQSALSWFVDAYSSVAIWKATTDRLLSFDDSLQQLQAEAGTLLHAVEGASPALHGARLDTPGGVPIVADATLRVAAGDRLLLTGPSGSGKSTVFRALAGIWPYGSGVVEQPAGKVLFLPQKPYLPIGTLRACVSYPAPSGDFSDDAIRSMLRECRLPQLVDQLDESSAWDRRLSPGEQQRLGFARALLNRPQWLFLDEATSALDEATGKALYRLLIERLPDAALISIAHDPSVAPFHRLRRHLTPAEGGAHLGAAQAVDLPPPAS
jgi:putative ATP-binding cassette transporter